MRRVEVLSTNLDILKFRLEVIPILTEKAFNNSTILNTGFTYWRSG